MKRLSVVMIVFLVLGLTLTVAAGKELEIYSGEEDTVVINQPSAWGSHWNALSPAEPIWDGGAPSEFVEGELWEHEREFKIPGNISSATLKIAADNGYRAEVNGVYVGEKNFHRSDFTECNVSTEAGQWQSIGDFPVTNLAPGENTLTIEAVNEAFYPGDCCGNCPHSEDGNEDNNPAGLIYKLVVEYEPFPEVYVDIKPGSCPNPINTNNRGVVSVAVLGTDDLDVTWIDPATVLLESDSPLRWSYEDVATPHDLDPFGCMDCHEAGGDGHQDLVFKFKAQDLVTDEEDGTCELLYLEGDYKDGGTFKGGDFVKVIDKGENDNAKNNGGKVNGR